MESFGGGGYFIDEKSVRVENIFLEFLKSFRVERNARELYYEAEIEAMRPKESNTMFIDFSDVMRFNDALQKAISEEFLRYALQTVILRLYPDHKRYKVGHYNYTWTLYPRTHVQLIHDPISYVCPYSFDYMKFSEMFRLADRDVSIAVKGLIVHSIPVHHPAKPFIIDYVFIDEERSFDQ